MMKFTKLTYNRLKFNDTKNDKIYDLTHLKPIKKVLKFKIKDRDYTFYATIKFSCHCWTAQRKKDDEQYLFIDDKVKFNKRSMLHKCPKRTFCSSRYKQSLNLPDIINNYLSNNTLIYKINNNKFFSYGSEYPDVFIKIIKSNNDLKKIEIIITSIHKSNQNTKIREKLKYILKKIVETKKIK